MRLWHVSATAFRRTLLDAQTEHARVAEATTPANDWDWTEDRDYYLTDDLSSGFAVTADGELVGVFSTVKGRGDYLLGSAVNVGARRLDCFDGYLTGFYASHGFRVVKRERNWVPGGPDVVYMERVA